MINLEYIIILLALACVSFYTASFALWTWRKKNRLGAIMIFVIALANIVLPVYSLLFRD